MPCYTEQLMSVEFHAKNRKLLDQALDALGWEYAEVQPNVLSINGGRIMLRLDQGQAELSTYAQKELNNLKQQYTRECARRACKLQGWQLKTTGHNQLELRR